MRFPLEVFDAVRAAWPADKPMSVRISATDWISGGTATTDMVAIARAFEGARLRPDRRVDRQDRPESKPGLRPHVPGDFADRCGNEAGSPTMAVGNITTADQVNTLLLSGRADLVALARPHLVDPYFTLHAAIDAGYEGTTWPAQYVPGAQQAYTLAKRAREDAAKKVAEAERPRHGR